LTLYFILVINIKVMLYIYYSFVYIAIQLFHVPIDKIPIISCYSSSKWRFIFIRPLIPNLVLETLRSLLFLLSSCSNLFDKTISTPFFLIFAILGTFSALYSYSSRKNYMSISKYLIS